MARKTGTKQELKAEELSPEVEAEVVATDNSPDKEITEDWEAYVRSEVESILNSVLPISKAGAVGIVYKNLVTEELEGGPVFDETKAVGVDVVLSFDFGGEIKKPM